MAGVPQIAVVGASGDLGRLILAKLYDVVEIEVSGTSRKPALLSDFLKHEEPPGILELDLEDVSAAAEALQGFDKIIFCPILSLSAPVGLELRKLGSEAQMIFFSSNNVGLDFESPVYEELRQAEAKISEMSGVWSIIRPTMIYGFLGDGNIGRLVQFAMTKSWMPMIGSGNALQQPIHYDDLCDLTVDLVLREDAPPRENGAAGPDCVSLAELYDKIIAAAERNVRCIRPPLGLIKPLLGKNGKIGPISAAQIRRAEIDKRPTWPLPEGWTAKISLEEGISDLVSQFRANAHK